MSPSLIRRRRSATVVTESTHNNNNSNGGISHNAARGRFHSVSSDIIPQTLEEQLEDAGSRTVRSSLSRPPSLSHVGFQSIFQSGDHRRSKQSLLSNESDTDRPLRTSESSDIGFDHSLSEARRSIDNNSSNSIHTSVSSLKGGRHSRLFSRSKDVISNSDKSAKLTTVTSNKSATSHSHSVLSNKSNTLSKVARKLFHRKQNRHDGDIAVEPAIPTSIKKFLHPSYLRHRTQSQFIHYSNAVVDSARSVYSFSPSGTNNVPENILLNDDENISANNTVMLHDLLKNLPSLEANYKNFSIPELTILSGNVWGVYCNVIVELFKNKRIWQLPAKIEDINRVLEFYAFLKTDSKVASPHSTFLNEVEDFISTSLYILENQIIFNYSNENTMNTLLKRIGVIWQVFYEQVYYDVMSVLLPLEKSFKTNRKYWSSQMYSDSGYFLSVDHILLKCFRDCIVLPYYQNFSQTNNGISKSFQKYIYNEEAENGVTDHDKLTLLQCFGVLSTIQGTDKGQKIIEELLTGIRMSI
ncbi:hypothetical protein Kpol_1066p20 [Vanderwaltozyma polyspora DSM 70294]|uniref:Target of rapamycin complex 2 subunit BIT2 n=1 Tax=Vanderwaltozyma polyspora (strain ATCC 22028 / DSM 70294 / BCRC 21397 / CBS 2163 / NBRC 10782 / NRRL Y-8283 / UCD 57-17) TaxID=436907 RepID=A7TMP1_VANPO|nr:uncharacterized protein Kpol_1066p20 [Vanderwaltozyma polyspora DSM 70294]EDO16455.1 hypothetical protein Kpol_1066p20 [Vanderwaltozyma polyspora DSM 70294]